MTPTTYRAGGANMDIRFAIGECSLGRSSRDKRPGRLRHSLGRRSRRTCTRSAGPIPPRPSDRRRHRIRAWPRWSALSKRPALAWTCRWTCAAPRFNSVFGRPCARFRPATPSALCEIANRIGSPTSVRAVAQACAANALAVAIPCHRVVRNDGGLSGYRWGVERKRALLAKEAHA